jgi:hypothetical protein
MSSGFWGFGEHNLNEVKGQLRLLEKPKTPHSDMHYLIIKEVQKSSPSQLSIVAPCTVPL